MRFSLRTSFIKALAGLLLCLSLAVPAAWAAVCVQDNGTNEGCVSFLNITPAGSVSVSGIQGTLNVSGVGTITDVGDCNGPICFQNSASNEGTALTFLKETTGILRQQDSTTAAADGATLRILGAGGGVGGDGGTLDISAGSPNTTGDGGDIFFTTANAAGASKTGGDMFFSLGRGSTSGTGNRGGTFSIDGTNQTGVAQATTLVDILGTTFTLADGVTITEWNMNRIYPPTINGIAGGGTETVTAVSTLTIVGPPAGTNTTFTETPADLMFGAGSDHVVRVQDEQVAGQGGKLTISAGEGNDDDGGDLVLNAGHGTIDGWGGNLYINTGNAVGNSNQGGELEIQTGDGGVDGHGGTMTILTGSGDGASTDADGGDFNVFLANGRGTGKGGDLDLEAGPGRGTNGEGGDALFQAGGLNCGADATTTPGDTTINTPDATCNVAGNTGNVTISTGSATAVGNNGIAGSIAATIGTSRGTNKNGGNITLTSGNTTGSGTGGSVLFDRADVTTVSVEQVPYRFNTTSITVADGTTITNQTGLSVLAPSLNGVAGGGTETYTNAATLYVDAAPSGTNSTITNPFAVWVDAGATRLDGVVGIGGNPISGGNVTIDGGADVIQFLVQGHSTQTSKLATFETSAGADAFTVSTAGAEVPDTKLLDLSAINASAATEGLLLPQATSISSATASGQLSYSTEGANPFVGIGTGAFVKGAATHVNNDVEFYLKDEMFGLFADTTNFLIFTQQMSWLTNDPTLVTLGCGGLANHPGCVGIQATNGVTTTNELAPNESWAEPDNNFITNAYVTVQDTAGVEYRIGISDGSTEQAIFFYDDSAHADTDWRCVTTAGGTSTTTDTNVPITTTPTFQKLTIRRSTTHILFSINDTQVCDHTTNLPTAIISVMPGRITDEAAGGVEELDLDYWDYYESGISR